ncbi:hypothetical protein [Aquimarina algiphila]|uniref:hypothetical protein n=1 Tax=Aquimarina algiphila TaxID=2047982 RepID=UPI00233070B1|nr:hypothetical protein [Aquimarina algiphila]
MLKRLLELFRKPKKYLTREGRKIIDSDLNDEVNRKLTNLYESSNNLYQIEKRKLIEIQVLIELIQENNNIYSDTEITKLYNEILREMELN